MRDIQMRFQCPDTFSEFLGDDEQHAALMIESIVSAALLEVFDTIFVRNVTVQHIPECIDADKTQSSVRYENV